MTWADARSALVTVLDGLQATADGYAPETLSAMEFVIPPARDVIRGGGGLRRVEVKQVRVRVKLFGEHEAEAAARMEAWVPALIDAIGDNITLNDGSGLVLGQQFTEFGMFGMGPSGEPLPPYGFDMELDVQITDVETRGA